MPKEDCDQCDTVKKLDKAVFGNGDGRYETGLVYRVPTIEGNMAVIKRISWAVAIGVGLMVAQDLYSFGKTVLASPAPSQPVPAAVVP